MAAIVREVDLDMTSSLTIPVRILKPGTFQKLKEGLDRMSEPFHWLDRLLLEVLIPAFPMHLKSQ